MLIADTIGGPMIGCDSHRLNLPVKNKATQPPVIFKRPFDTMRKSQHPNAEIVVTEKHRRDGKSRLGTSRNVQWSAEGVTDFLCSRAHNLVNLSSLRVA